MNFVGLVLGLSVSIKRLITHRGAVQKIIIMLLTLTGTILSTSFGAFLQSFTTEHPREPIVENLNELLNSEIEIYIQEYEYNNFKAYADDYKAILPHLTIYNRNQSKSGQFRENYPYAAFILRSYDWNLYNARQQIYDSRVHRVTDICPFSNIARKLPCAANFFSVKALNNFIMHLPQTGLMYYWFWRDLYRLKRSDVPIKKKSREYEVLKVEDLGIVFALYGLLITLSICCFFIELNWNRLQQIKRKRYIWRRCNKIGKSFS